MRSIRLHELIQFLNQQTQSSFQGSAVDAYLASRMVELDDLVPFSRFREDTYARNQVRCTPLYELLVLAWLPGQKAAAHNHAGQRCWTTILTGELSFQNFHPDLTEKGELRPLGELARCVAGEADYIDDEEGLHSIANAGRLPTLSLHLYAAPVKECLVYDEKKRGFKRVALQSFPPPPETEWIEAHPAPLESPE